MIAQARSIAHGKAYSEYAERKDKAVFVGADNMITNTDIIFDNPDFINELWGEFKEAGLDYVRKGKDVTRDTIVIEFSPLVSSGTLTLKSCWKRWINVAYRLRYGTLKRSVTSVIKTAV